jgi:acetate kinase
MQILVFNTGSSSVKFALITAATEEVAFSGLADWSAQPARFELDRPGSPAVKDTLAATSPGAAVDEVLRRLPALGPIAAVGHRVVHGGSFTRAVRVTPDVKAELMRVSELAPLHNPVALEGLTAAAAAWPDVPQVAVFDTSFHATLSEAARTYALPHSWTHDWGLRRYGFHGLSHAYCTGRAAQMLGRGDARLVICHLGFGCSASAVAAGVCVDTSMGFTPLDGLMMGTRSGSVDPGLLMFAMRHKGLTPDQVDTTLNRESGLLGVSGVSGDMRQVETAAANGNKRARLALEMFTRRLRQMIGAMAVTLGGVDALVFTAGIGEHSPKVRADACRGLECLGLELDMAANTACKPDVDVASTVSRGRILVIATREDISIVRAVVEVLGEKPG